MTPRKPLIFLVKVRGFLFQLVSRQTTKFLHLEGRKVSGRAQLLSFSTTLPDHGLHHRRPSFF